MCVCVRVHVWGWTCSTELCEMMWVMPLVLRSWILLLAAWNRHVSVPSPCGFFCVSEAVTKLLEPDALQDSSLEACLKSKMYVSWTKKSFDRYPPFSDPPTFPIKLALYPTISNHFATKPWFSLVLYRYDLMMSIATNQRTYRKIQAYQNIDKCGNLASGKSQKIWCVNHRTEWSPFSLCWIARAGRMIDNLW